MLTSSAAARVTAISAGVRMRCIRSRTPPWSENAFPGIASASAALKGAVRRSPMTPRLPRARPKSLRTFAAASTVLHAESPGMSAYSRPIAPSWRMRSTPTGSPPGGRITDWV